MAIIKPTRITFTRPSLDEAGQPLAAGNLTYNLYIDAAPVPVATGLVRDVNGRITGIDAYLSDVAGDYSLTLSATRIDSGVEGAQSLPAIATVVDTTQSPPEAPSNLIVD